MTRLRLVLPLAAAIACDARSSSRGVAAELVQDGPRCLSIVAWNDLHGQIGPDLVALDTGKVPLGGVIALADEVAQLRATRDAVVTLDAGDLFTGPIESTMAEGAPIIDAYKALGVDAVAIGNHEFDFGPVGYERVTAPPDMGDEVGPDGPRGALLARMAEAPFPFLSANIVRVGGSSTGWKNHASRVIIARDGFKVGVVGYTTQETPTTTFAANVAGLSFSAGAAGRVAEAVRALRGEGASPVVLLAHASLEGDLPQMLDDDKPHKGEVATLLEGASDARSLPDLVLAGHRHQWMLGRVRGVPIVSSDYHGLGVARARFCREAAPARATRLEAIERRVVFAPATPTTELGARVAGAVAPWIQRVKKEADVVLVAESHACAARSQCGTCLQEQVARAIAEHAPDAAPVPAGVPVIGFIHTGGLRASLPAGALRFADVFNAYPFENSVGVCGTTKKGLSRLLVNALTKDLSARDRMPFGIVGAKVKLQRKETQDLALVSLDVPGAKSDDAPVYIAMPDFLLYGGDDFLAGVACNPAATSSTRVRDAWKAVLLREKGGCDGNARNIVVD
jgi:5'-nucleotidase